MAGAVFDNYYLSRSTWQRADDYDDAVRANSGRDVNPPKVLLLYDPTHQGHYLVRCELDS